MNDRTNPVRASLRQLVVASEGLAKISYELVGDNDKLAWDAFAERAVDLVGAPQAVVAQAFWAARWREQRFPRVVLGPRRASSLMATGVAAEQMEIVRPPWKAFVVDLIDSPIDISVAPTLGGRSVIDRIEVQYATHHGDGAPRWWMIAESVAGPSLHRFAVAAGDWINDKLTFEGPVDAFSTLEVGDEDLRVLSLLSRLVAGLCLSLSEPTAIDLAAQRGTSKSYKRRRRGPPMLRDYVFGDDVRVDVRDAIAQYVRRGGRAPTVRTLVRGHWKMQPYGPEGGLRKWLHIEPYWRGPENAERPSRSA